MKLYKGKAVLGYSQIEVCLVIKKEQEQSINTEHLKYEFCINFGRKDWWIPETITRVKQYGLWTITHLFRIWRTHDGKFNKKDVHIEKEIRDCNYEIHKNLCSNRPTFGSVILLMIDHKMHNTKYHGFQPCLPLLRVYL